MGVIIDEVIGEVDPSSGYNQQQDDEIEHKTVTTTTDELELSHKLQLLNERQLRIKAD